MKAIFLLFFALSTLGGRAQPAAVYKLASPDKQTRLEVAVDAQGQLRYRASYAGQPVVAWSALGFALSTGAIAGTQSTIQGATQKEVNEPFAWPLGENDTIGNHYQELDVRLQSARVAFHLLARVYDGSVAFRYELPAQASLPGAVQLTAERTEFNLTIPYTLYQYHQESVFRPAALDSLAVATCDFPATLASAKNYLSIGEADNDGYTKAELGRGNAPHGLAIAFVQDKQIAAPLPFHSPWRTISFARTAVGLHRCSELNLKLNPAAPSGVPAGVQPGKVMRAQLTTQSGLDCIDLAARLRMRYILYDAGWYGPERALTSDPAVVIPAIDLPRVIAYGKQKGIGIILYVNYIGLQRHLDAILPLYKQWGVAGLKFGFVDGLSQAGLMWLAGAIKKVNDAGLVLNVHDNYKPTGLSRTYPALLTQEGIRGDENSPDAFHTTTLPFTRFLAGPADFTFCYPNPTNSFGKNLKVSKAQQLALTVVYVSPLQALFWYGRPMDYTNEAEIEFFKYVPTVWNESRYLAGDIGRGISVARRAGTTWFIGSAAGLQDWSASLRLDFLKKGTTYTATIFADDDRGSIVKRTVYLRRGAVLPVTLHAKGGQAIMLEETK